MALAERLLGGRLRVVDQLLKACELREVLEGVKASTYFGRNRGSHDFYRGTRGFSLVFRKPWRRQVRSRLDSLEADKASTGGGSLPLPTDVASTYSACRVQLLLRLHRSFEERLSQMRRTFRLIGSRSRHF